MIPLTPVAIGFVAAAVVTWCIWQRASSFANLVKMMVEFERIRRASTLHRPEDASRAEKALEEFPEKMYELTLMLVRFTALLIGLVVFAFICLTFERAPPVQLMTNTLVAFSSFAIISIASLYITVCCDCNGGLVFLPVSIFAALAVKM